MSMMITKVIMITLMIGMTMSMENKKDGNEDEGGKQLGRIQKQDAVGGKGDVGEGD